MSFAGRLDGQAMSRCGLDNAVAGPRNVRVKFAQGRVSKCPRGGEAFSSVRVAEDRGARHEVYDPYTDGEERRVHCALCAMPAEKALRRLDLSHRLVWTYLS